MLRAISIRRAGATSSDLSLFDFAVLAQDERHLRRKAITLRSGGKVLVDLPEPVVLGDGDVLVLDDGRHVGIVAAEEDLYEIRGRDGVHLAELAWHIGNRHLAAQVFADRILVRRDHVIAHMLEHQGAHVREIEAPFDPEGGAYQEQSHAH